MTYYMAYDEDVCFPLKYYKEVLKDENIKAITLREMKTFSDDWERWCKIYELIHNDDCGKCCKHYTPCNGKSGKCRNQGKLYEHTGRIFQLSEHGLTEVTNED